MPDNFASEFQLLRGKYAARLEDQADEIRELWHMLRMVKWSEQGIKTLQQLAHQLTGSGATFGYPDISASAKVIEDYLLEHQNPTQPIDGKKHSLIDLHMANLTEALISASHSNQYDADRASLTPVAKGHNRSVFIVDGDTALSELLAVYLRSAGFIVRTFASPDDCLPELNQQPPDIILMDPGFPAHGQVTGTTQGPAAIYEAHQLAGNQLPIILMSSRSDTSAQLQSLRAGAAGYLAKPINLSQLVNILLAKIEQYEPDKRVMIVDDEISSADYHAGILRNHGMTVMEVTQPMRSLQSVGEFKPDLVILNVATADITGAKLAELLRQQARFSLLPIIFLTKDQSPQSQQPIPGHRLEVNGLLTKPVVSTFFVVACQDALREAQRLRGRMDRVTRFTNHHQVTRHYLFAAIENALQQPQATKRVTAIYYIGVDPLAELNERYGYAVMSQLHETFCQRLASVLGGQEQWNTIANLTACVHISDRTSDQHHLHAAHIIHTLAEENYVLQGEQKSLTFSLGIFYVDSNTLSVNDALQKAEAACEAAQRAGGNCVVTYQSPSGDRISDPEQQLLPDKGPLTTAFFQLPFEQLALSYQPIVKLKDIHCDHYEAVVRWRMEDGELISAARFLAKAKDPQTRMELDRWILQTAAAAMVTPTGQRGVTRLFLPFPVQRLQQEEFLSFAENLIREQRLGASRQMVFIVDGPQILADPKLAERLIKLLHAIHCGVCLALAGQSSPSLPLIRRLPFDYVRLAGDFTENIDTDPLQRTAVAALIEAAQYNKTRLLAAQVKDSTHLSHLWELGVELFQGFDIQSGEKIFHHKKTQGHAGQSYH